MTSILRSPGPPYHVAFSIKFYAYQVVCQIIVILFFHLFLVEVIFTLFFLHKNGISIYHLMEMVKDEDAN